MSPSENILETTSLSKRFGGIVAVAGLDIKIKRGEIHALIGPNGAGKTTVFNLLTGFLKPTSGKITFNSSDITGRGPAALAQRGMVRSFQISAVFNEFTALENVRIALQGRLGYSYHFWKSHRVLNQLNERALQLLEQVGLSEFHETLAGELAYGRKRVLEIATTLATEPSLMLLDEPTQGMGHEDVSRITDLIRQVAKDRTVLMVEHNLNVVSTLAQTITVLSRGSILSQGSYAKVSADPQVIEAYMGSVADV